MESLARLVALIALSVVLVGPLAAILTAMRLYVLGGLLGVVAVVAGLWWVSVTRSAASSIAIIPILLGVHSILKMLR